MTTTMREFIEDEGYDPENLVKPQDVEAGQITDETTILAYTVVRNPDPNAPSTTYELGEYTVQDVLPTEKVVEETDGSVSYPDDTPVTHGVVWAHRSMDGLPKFASIGHSDEMYDDGESPNRLERSVEHVRSLPDDWIQFLADTLEPASEWVDKPVIDELVINELPEFHAGVCTVIYEHETASVVVTGENDRLLRKIKCNDYFGEQGLDTEGLAAEVNQLIQAEMDEL